MLEIDEILANIKNTSYVCTLDLTSGNFQTPTKSDDVAETAFYKNGSF